MAVDPDVPPVIDTKIQQHTTTTPHLGTDTVEAAINEAIATHTVGHVTRTELDTLSNTVTGLETRVTALEVGNAPPPPPPPPATLDVDSITFSHGHGPRTLANPGQNTGNTLVFIATRPGPAVKPANDWVKPTGQSPVPDGEYNGVNYVPGYQIWFGIDSGQPEFTFGFAGGYPQTSTVIALTGIAAAVRIATPPRTETGLSSPYPLLETAPNMLGICIAVQQSSGDALTHGPPGSVTLFNNTSTKGPRGLAVHTLRATGPTLTPGPAKWAGTAGAHVQTVLAVG